MNSCNFYFDMAEMTVAADPHVQYGDKIDFNSIYGFDEDDMPVGFQVQHPINSMSSLIGKKCVIERGDASATGTCLDVDNNSIGFLQDGKVVIMRHYDNIACLESHQAGSITFDEPCTCRYIAKDYSWRCNGVALVSGNVCTLLYFARLSNQSGKPFTGNVICTAKHYQEQPTYTYRSLSLSSSGGQEDANHVDLEDSTSYALGHMTVETEKKVFLARSTINVGKCYSFTLGDNPKNVYSFYQGSLREYSPQCDMYLYGKVGFLGITHLDELQPESPIKLKTGISSAITITENTSVVNTKGAKTVTITCTMKCQKPCQIMIYYDEGGWESASPPGYIQEGNRIYWLVALNPSKVSKMVTTIKYSVPEEK